MLTSEYVLTQEEIDSLLKALDLDDELFSLTCKQKRSKEPFGVFEMTEKNKQTILRSLKFEMDYLRNRLKEIESVYFAISEK